MSARRVIQIGLLAVQCGRLAVAKRQQETECRRAGIDVAEVAFIRRRLNRRRKP